VPVEAETIIHTTLKYIVDDKIQGWQIGQFITLN
jgi:hypothetical protein